MKGIQLFFGIVWFLICMLLLIPTFGVTGLIALPAFLFIARSLGLGGEE